MVAAVGAGVHRRVRSSRSVNSGSQSSVVGG